MPAAVRGVLRSAVAQSVLSAVVVTVLCVVAAVAWAGAAAHRRGLDPAQARTGALVAGVVAPLVTPELLAGEGEARRRLEEAVRERLRDAAVAGVELRSGDGRVVFTGAPGAGPDRPGQVVEVDLPLGAVDGTELVLATLLPSSGARDGMLALAAPGLVLGGGGLALLLALQVPQTLRLTRRLEEEAALRLHLAQQLARVRGEERERLAGELRDGVMQDLAGVGYLLDSLQPELPEESLRAVLARAGDVVRRDLFTLRALAHEDSAGPSPA